MRKLFAKLPSSGLITGLVVAALVIGARFAGGLQNLELYAYDLYVRGRTGVDAAPSPVVLVGADEYSLTVFGWPLNDQVVAELLGRLVAAGATVVGFDIYRDRPQPPGTDRLNAVLADNPEIIAVYKFVDADGNRVAPPSVLAKTDRFGFADLLVDSGGIVRRGLLFMDDGATTGQAFAFRLATAYLDPAGIFAVPDAENPEDLRLGPTTIPPIGGNHGAYVGADARGYQFMLDYRRGRQPFPVYSLVDVLDDQVPADAFTDKLVIVGAAAVSVHDRFFTPFSGARDPTRATLGMEIHGAAADQLIRYGLGHGRPDRTLADWQENLWILVWCLAAGVAAAFARGAWRMALGLAGLAGLAVAASYVGFNMGWWLPVVPVAIGVVGAAALASADLAGRSRRAREILIKSVRSFLPASVVDSLARAEPPASHAETVYGVCLKADIAGFTTTAETAIPEAIHQELSDFFAPINECVERSGGEILDEVGDGMMCLWRDPEAVADRDRSGLHRRACLAALEIVGLVDRYDERHAERPFHLRIGLHAGHLARGVKGGGGHYEIAITGDVPNTVSRIESLNKHLGTTLLASVPVVDGLDDLLIRPLGKFQLFGRKGIIQICEIMGEKRTLKDNKHFLCNDFASALSKFQDGDVAGAALAFGEFVSRYPSDGPISFFKQHAALAATAGDVDGIVRLSEK